MQNFSVIHKSLITIVSIIFFLEKRLLLDYDSFEFNIRIIELKNNLKKYEFQSDYASTCSLFLCYARVLWKLIFYSAKNSVHHHSSSSLFPFLEVLLIHWNNIFLFRCRFIISRHDSFTLGRINMKISIQLLYVCLNCICVMNLDEF